MIAILAYSMHAVQATSIVFQFAESIQATKLKKKGSTFYDTLGSHIIAISLETSPLFRHPGLKHQNWDYPHFFLFIYFLIVMFSS